MSKRVIGLLAAVVLALVGTVALVAFVAGAEERALEGEELVEVYVVTDLIAGGTAGDELEESVIVEEVPAKVRPLDAVDNLAALRGRVAAVDLQPGEQLIESRFVELDEFADRAVGVQIPDDMVEVTVALDPERAIGGLLEPGQTVTVIASFEPFQLSATVVEIDGQEVALPAAVADSVEGATPNTTDIILRKVLVTAVQQEANSSLGTDEEANRLNTAPDGSILVTLAVPPFDAERVVFTAEFGTLWLAVEREDVPELEDSIKTRGNVYDENDDEDDEPIEPAADPAEEETTDEEADAASDEGEEAGTP